MTEQARKPLPRGRSARSALVEFVKGSGAVEAVGSSRLVPADPFDNAINSTLEAFGRREASGGGLARQISRAVRKATVADEPEQGARPAGKPTAREFVAGLSPKAFERLQDAAAERSARENNFWDTDEETESGEDGSLESLWPGVEQATEEDLAELEEEHDLEELFASFGAGADGAGDEEEVPA